MRLRRAPARPPPHRTPRHARRRPAPPLLFRGWLVVTGAFLVLMAGYGAAYSDAAFAAELKAAFDASRASVSMVYAICGCAAFAVSAVSGPLADRIGPRPLAAAGMGLVAVGLLTAAAARTLLEIYLGYGLVIGLGIGFAYVPATAAVQRWFVAWRGLASGMAAAGIGVGTALVPPAACAAAALGGWRAAFAAPAPLAAEGAGLAEALRHRDSWLHYAGTLLVSMPVSLPFAHLAQSATDAGLPRTEALALLSLLGIGSIAGRFALGAVVDEIGREATFLGCAAAVVGLTALWAMADGHLLLIAFAIGFGAAYGGFVALLPAVTADRFGRRGVGGIIGVLFTGRGIALLIAAPALALLTDWTGGYAVPLGVMALAGGCGVALLAVVPRSL